MREITLSLFLGISLGVPLRAEKVSLSEEAIGLARSSEPLSAQALLDLQKRAYLVMRTPSTEMSRREVWAPWLQQVALQSADAAPDFAQSKTELVRWLSLMLDAKLGSVAERKSTAVSTWHLFAQHWQSSTPENLKELLNCPLDTGEGVYASERNALAYSHNVLLARSAAQAVQSEEPLLVPIKLDDVGTAYLARTLLAAGQVNEAVKLLDAAWKQQRAGQVSAQLLAAMFMVHWYGSGDRNYGQQLVSNLDALIAQNKLSTDSADVRAIYESYYRGILLTSDELRSLRIPDESVIFGSVSP